jgi:hypothetical protein
VSDPVYPASLDREVAELRRRLDNLERSTSLNSAAIQDGSLSVLDASNNSRLVIGKTNASGVYGIKANNTSGTVVFEVNSAGLSRPLIPLATTNPYNAVIDVTAGAYDRTWIASTGAVSQDAVWCNLYLGSDVGTTGSVRLKCDIRTTPLVASATFTSYSVALAIPSGYGEPKTVKFAPGWPVNAGGTDVGFVYITVEAYRTGGAGNVAIWQPTGIFQVGMTDIGLGTSGDGTGVWL